MKLRNCLKIVKDDSTLNESLYSFIIWSDDLILLIEKCVSDSTDEHRTDMLVKYEGMAMVSKETESTIFQSCKSKYPRLFKDFVNADNMDDTKLFIVKCYLEEISHAEEIEDNYETFTEEEEASTIEEEPSTSEEKSCCSSNTGDNNSSCSKGTEEIKENLNFIMKTLESITESISQHSSALEEIKKKDKEHITENEFEYEYYEEILTKIVNGTIDNDNQFMLFFQTFLNSFLKGIKENVNIADKVASSLEIEFSNILERID